MINKNKIIIELNNNFTKAEELHLEHKKRVIKAINWFNSIVVDKSTNKATSSMVKLNDVDAVCIYTNIRGVPFFECYFIFMPYNVTDDLGSGRGKSHIVEF